MMDINEIIKLILKDEKPATVASKLGVTTAMISTWKNAGNDFTPRKEVAAKIAGVYGYTVYPFSTSALLEIYNEMVAKGIV